MKTIHSNYLILATLLATHVFAFDAKLTVNPPVISMNESAELTLEIRGAKGANAPRFPNVNGLQFAGTGKSSQMNIINGKMDRSVSFTTTIYPQRTGEFSIGPFAYTIGKETQTLQAHLKVVGTSDDAANPQSWSDLVFAKLQTSKHEAYVQEPFELTLSIYSRQGVQIDRNIGLQNMPETGISELKWTQHSQTREPINGTVFDVTRYKTTVRTMGSGRFEFEPTVTIPVVLPNQRRSFFGQYQTRPVEIQLKKTTVSVQPLPTLGKPADFSGAVGNFQFQATADPRKAQPGDPITVTMTVIGSGNFDRVLPPELPETSAFRLFGDAVRHAGNNGVRFEQVISATSASVSNIPPIAFSFFDTKRKTYRTLTSRPIPLEITASSAETAQLFASNETVIQPDLPFVVESDVQRAVGFMTLAWQSVRPWLWTLPTAVGLGLFLFFAKKLYHWRRKDTAWMRRQKAPKAARKALKQATLARKNEDTPAFYNALWNALAEYFGNRLNLAPGEISAPVVFQALENSTLSVETLEPLKALFDQIDAGRYSPVPPSSEKTEQQLLILTQTLKQCEKCKFQ